MTAQDIQILRDVALEAIEQGLNLAKAPLVAINRYPKHLCETGASFVTLKKEHRLRGCIGSLVAHRPLILDINNNAYAAAFEDKRFSPVIKEELPLLELSISILNKPVIMNFKDEEDLLSQITPIEDGLILQDRGFRGTFLPSVWDELPNKEDFLKHLKLKAGLTADYWSPSLVVYKYKVFVI